MTTELPPGWKARARERLVGEPRRRLRVGELLGAALPAIPCALPWTRMELSTRHLLGPCCPDYQAAPEHAGGAVDLVAAWNGPTQRAFRRALASPGHPVTCRATCPLLQGGREALSQMRLAGGSPAFVDNQLTAVEDAVEGREVARALPLDVMFTPTTFCNYDCLMCEWGEVGTLDDALGADFYEGLEPLLPTLRALEAAGGEPLASSAFRDFLATLDFRRHPDLRISLVTNGSYLTPGMQARLSRVPFSTLIFSLNGATPETYEAVNRGLPFARVRGNLDALLEHRRAGTYRGGIAYSMVILERNCHEIEALARMAEADGVDVRFMLPMFDRNGQSIMTDPDLMRASLERLDAVARRLEARGEDRQARDVRGEAQVLRARLEAGIFAPLPDGRADPTDPPPAL